MGETARGRVEAGETGGGRHGDTAYLGTGRPTNKLVSERGPSVLPLLGRGRGRGCR